MFYISVKITTKDKQSVINYLKSLVNIVSYLEYNSEDGIVTISDKEDHDEIINILSSYGTILKKSGEKSQVDSFIDELISQSSDINELATGVYSKLGIKVRRSCDKRFASMISSFQESENPVCMSTVEETVFSPNNFKTFAKACAEKGFDPFEFIAKICEKYNAINKKKDEKEPDEQVITTKYEKAEPQKEETYSLIVEKTEPPKGEIDFFIDELISRSSDINELATSIYSKLGITVRRSCDKRFASMISSFIESGAPVCMSTIEETVFSLNNFKTLAKACADKGFEPFEFIAKICDKYTEHLTTEPIQQVETQKNDLKREGQTLEAVKKPVIIRQTLKPSPTVTREPIKRKPTPKRTNPNDFSKYSDKEKMNMIRSNYNIAFKNTTSKNISLESALEYLSDDALKILSLAVAEEPDIEQGQALIEAEAKRRECGNIGYQIRQVYQRLKRVFEASSKDYPVINPVKTLHYFQQLCANQDTASLMRMISHNLAVQDRVEDAINFCHEIGARKNREDVYTQQNRQTDNLIKELKSVDIAKLILQQIHGDSVYSDSDFMKTLENTMDRNNIRTNQIWLGRNQNGQVDILLSDVWYDKNLSITSFLLDMLGE